MSEYLNLKEVCDLLSSSGDDIEDFIRHHGLPFKELPNKILLFHKREVLKWLKNRPSDRNAVDKHNISKSLNLEAGSLEAFINECLRHHPQGKIYISDLIEVYSEWFDRQVAEGVPKLHKHAGIGAKVMALTGTKDSRDRGGRFIYGLVFRYD